ncbi:MAG: RNA polymerase sigma factor, partial [Planctomycetota bacterium]
EEAKDLTQGFFARVFQPEFLDRADPARGNFRTFVLASVKNFLRESARSERALKRGGGVRILPLDDADFDVDPPAKDADPEQEFMKTWAAGVMGGALRELEGVLKGRGKEKVFRAFRAYCMESEAGEKPSYKKIAGSLGVSETDVTHYLFEARRELRVILAEKVGEYLSSPAAVDDELRALFGS